LSARRRLGCDANSCGKCRVDDPRGRLAAIAIDILSGGHP
jgi:hypothetical protein